jgi:H(+)-translocating pyrophosphatase
VIHVIDLIVSTIGVYSVQGKSRGGGYADEDRDLDPMTVLKKGSKVAIALSSIGFIISCRVMLNVDSAPRAWRHFAACGFVGMGTGFLIVLICQYYTDFNFGPVRGIASAAELGGHGTNVIAGLSVGFSSTMLPVLVVGCAILLSYSLGKTAGLDFQGVKPEAWAQMPNFPKDPAQAAGLFGTAVATMGMLSNLTYVLAMDVFGPITDNAAGIVEMSPECPSSARDIMDRLDAAGNTTKAFTKGFAVGSAGLACFLLFRAFLDIVEQNDPTKKIVVDIVSPEVFVAGLVGGATVFLFAGIAMDAVGETAQKVVVEVRRQFHEIPGIMTNERKPEYGKCVAIVSQAAIKKMIKPGLLVLIMPVIVGRVFYSIGAHSGDELLGAKAMTAYLVVSSMTAILVALLLNNAGGAWDNAKKYIEAGHHGGKGSDAHKGAVTGDTVGDPCKDTAGPSLHVLMKLTATVTMVVGPLITMPAAQVAASVVTSTMMPPQTLPPAAVPQAMPPPPPP